MEINQCVELYKLMAERCASSGMANNQAEVYSEMVDFIGTCSSVEESMSKIKNSKYYLAPSVALVKDKLCAWKSAAVDNDMPEIVEVVDKKLESIEKDNSEIYVTGYEQTIQKYKNKYILTMQAFVNIFDCYIGYIATGEDYNLSDINKNLEKLVYPSSDFVQLANLKQFKLLVPVNQAGYDIFVSDIENYITTDKLICSCLNHDDFDLDSETQEAWEDVQTRRDYIIKSGKDSNNPSIYRHNLDEMKAIAPDVKQDNPSDIDGLYYTYTNLDFDDKEYESCSKKPGGFFSRLRGE